MAIFDLILEQTLGIQEIQKARDYATTFEPLFKVLGANIEDYDWELLDPDNILNVRHIKRAAIGNLIYAAQDMEIFPAFMEIADFCFEDGITFDITEYTEEEARELRKVIKEFEDRTGLTITIEE